MRAKKLTIAVPVYNEEIDLPNNLPVLYHFLKQKFVGYDWKVVIADNGPSTDATGKIGRGLAARYKRIEYIQISTPGRGNALKKVWSTSNADILAYMDVDLSSDLLYFQKLIAAVEAGADIAVGSRLLPKSRVYGRTLFREVISRVYNFIVRLGFWVSFHDAQCGFKAITQDVAQKVLPKVQDTSWFFDTELLILAEKSGFRIVEIPIVWHDDPNSTVKVARTAWGDIKGLIRLFLTRPWKKL